jgi:hypothetical protein
MTTLSPAAAEALKACYATRGKHKGRLLAKCPPSNTLAAAAWQAAMLICNPYKVSICSMLFMTEEQRAIRNEVESYFDALPRDARIAADRDRAALEHLGVW